MSGGIRRPRSINRRKGDRKSCTERSPEELGRASEKEATLLKEFLQVQLVETGKGSTDGGAVQVWHARQTCRRGRVRMGLEARAAQLGAGAMPSAGGWPRDGGCGVNVLRRENHEEAVQLAVVAGAAGPELTAGGRTTMGGSGWAPPERNRSANTDKSEAPRSLRKTCNATPPVRRQRLPTDGEDGMACPLCAWSGTKNQLLTSGTWPFARGGRAVVQV